MTSDGDSLELEAYRVHRPTQSAMSSIQHTLNGSTVFEYAYAVRSRIKPVDKIVEKVERKRADGKEDYEPSSLTDILGLRFVVLFRDDLLQVLEVLLQIFSRKPPYETAPFIKGKLREAIYYVVQRGGDPEALEERIREAIRRSNITIEQSGNNSTDTGFQVKPTDTGYSSLHLVTYCEVSEKGGTCLVPVEIQLRTVFEDAWGEIDHKLRYSLDRAKKKGHIDETTFQERLASWEPHLHALKSYLDSCALYAGLIRAQSIAQRALPYYRGPLRPIESFEDAKKRIGAMPQSIEISLKHAYEIKEQAEKLNAGIDREGKILTAAGEFRAIKDQLKEETTVLNLQARSAIDYFVSMEEAYCYLLIGTSEKIDQAIVIYTGLARNPRQDATLAYRLGSAYADKGDFEAASAKLTDAVTALSQSSEFPGDHYIRTDVPKRRGFVEWMRTNTLSDVGTRLEGLKQAFIFTCEAAEENALVINNKLYYLVAYFEGKGSELSELSVTKDEVRRLFGLARTQDPPQTWNVRISLFDTFCRAAMFLGQNEVAREYANKIYQIINEKFAIGDSESARLASLSERIPSDLRTVWEYCLVVRQLSSA